MPKNNSLLKIVSVRPFSYPFVCSYSYYYYYYSHSRSARETANIQRRIMGGGPGKSTRERLRRRRRSLANVSRRAERVPRAKVRLCRLSSMRRRRLRGRCFYLFDFTFAFLLFTGAAGWRAKYALLSPSRGDGSGTKGPDPGRNAEMCNYLLRMNYSGIVTLSPS